MTKNYDYYTKIKYKKEFKKICPAYLEIEDYKCDLRPVMKKVERFFVRKMKKIREDSFNEAINSFAWRDED